MRSMILFLGLFVCGCETPLPSHSCETHCFASFTSVTEIDCDRVEANIRVLQETFDSFGFVSSSDFCPVFSEVTVFVREEGGFFYMKTETGKQRVTGMFVGVDMSIELTRDALTLAHELLHAYDTVHGIPTSDHPDWETNGYYSLVSEYVDKALSLDPIHYLEEPLRKSSVGR